MDAKTVWLETTGWIQTHSGIAIPIATFLIGFVLGAFTF